MEIIISILAFLVFCYALFLLSSRKKSKLPPSPPWALPLFGHMHMLGKFPHKSLQKLAQKHGGLMYLKLGSIDTVIASTSDAARDILKTHDQVFASRPAVSAAEHFGYNGKDLAWAPYGDYWRNTRKLCTLEILTNKRVELFQPCRKLEMTLLLKDILEISKSNSAANLTDKLTDLTFNIMTRIIINKSCSGASSRSQKERALAFKNIIAEALTLASGTNFRDFIPQLSFLDFEIPKVKDCQRRRDALIQLEIDEHKERWAKDPVVLDFVDAMLATESLNDTSMKGLAMDMIGAGTDSSGITMEWGFAELVRQPKLLKKAQEELDQVIGKERTMVEEDIPKLKFLQAIVKELLRLHPPTPLLFPHQSTEECQIGEYVIPAKCRAFVNAYAIARDPTVWSEPDLFDPERFLGPNSDIDIKGQSFDLLPFGSGRRMCPAVNLAQTMLHHAMGSLLHAFDWEIPNGGKPEDVDMTEAFGLTVPRATPLLLVPSPRLVPEAYQN